MEPSGSAQPSAADRGSSLREPQALGAVAASVALHIALLSLAFVPWPAPVEIVRVENASLVFVTDPPAVASGRGSTADAGARLPAEPDAAPPLETRVPEPLPQLERPAVEPEPPPQPEAPAVEPEPSPDAEPRGPGAPSPADDVDAPPPRNIDWEAERQRAAREVVEQRVREARYRTFSLDDLDGPEPPPEEPGLERSVFDSPAGTGRPSLLAPDQEHGRVGRWLAEKCHAITGGISVLGAFGLCTQSRARNDLFASIKPDYLKARPECTPVEQPVMPDGSPAKKTHDCRLVVEDE